MPRFWLPGNKKQPVIQYIPEIWTLCMYIHLYRDGGYCVECKLCQDLICIAGDWFYVTKLYSMRYQVS